MKTIVFTGGGTGGHIYPGLAVIEHLKTSDNIRIVWIGNRTGMDRGIVEKAGVEFRGIPSGKLRRYLSIRNLLDVFKVAGGFFASFFILLKLKPALVFSKGGFVSVPPCAAARLLGIPVFTHESDVTPGLATRMNAKSAARIYVSYESTVANFPETLRNRVVVTGNPVRPVLYRADGRRGRAFFGIPGGVPVVLVIGGSQGAGQVNDLILAVIDRLVETCVVIHQTGAGNFDPARFAVDGKRAGRYFPVPYINAELPDVLAGSDLVITRAGAGTVWECAVTGRPMVLIPLEGSGTRGDQVLNAAAFREGGAAVVLSGSEATPENLERTVLGLIASPAKLAAMAEACRSMARTDAAALVARNILEEIGSSV